MIKILLGYVVCAAIILFLDWKVVRTLAPVNRWLTYAILLCGMGVWAYSLRLDEITYASVWVGKLLNRWVPFS
ncbi:hypothetical protein [Paenibacillus pini]|uniref:Uncharacterized protein n=1 Tax=Paenibacillus pini JCM 16418 TaxID=1236976 RepID=W7YGT9_9BACL|nr:hypothetical protein [Paenibacillus pini]GAF10125.1 hypothetical protein JCM16418_4300 [Paenibacillus pini JCM 16418]